MSDLKALLERSTPAPWAATLDGTVWEARIVDGVPVLDGGVLAEFAGFDNAALAVYLRSRAEDYEAAVEALERLIAFDEDPNEYEAMDEARAALRRLRGAA